MLGAHVGVWAVQLGALAAARHLDPGRLGVALSGAAAGGIVTLLLGGRIADRVGRRAVLLAGFVLAGVAFALLALADAFPAVLAAVVLYGLSISFVDLGANAVAADVERVHAVRAMTGLQAGFSLGAVLGATGSAVALANGVDYRAVYAALTALFLLAAVLVAVARLPDAGPAAPGGDRVRVWRIRGVLFATAVLLVTFFGDGALEGFTAVFLRRALAGGVLLSGVGIAGFHLASFIGRVLVGGPLRALPTRPVVVTAGVLASAGVGIAVLAPSPWTSVGGLLLVGFAISPVVPGALSVAARSAPAHAGRAVAFTTAVGYGSFLVAPLAVGGIADAAGLRVGLGVVAGTALLLAGLATRWPADPVTDGRSGRRAPG